MHPSQKVGCPCQKVGENGFGRAFVDRSHPKGDLTMFHAQVETPIREEQIEDFDLSFDSP